MTDESPAKYDDLQARRNVFVLAAAGAIGGSGAPINIAVAGLAGHALLGADKSLATLPVTAFVIGTACGTFPAAMLMRQIGRRAGFVFGLLLGSGGGLVEALAVSLGQFWLLCVGAFLMGIAAAFVQQFRFAVTDTASPGFRPKALSLVMVGGIFAAIIGPQTAIWTNGLLPGSPYLATYLAASVLLVLGAIIVSFVNIPRPGRGKQRDRGRPLSEFSRQSGFIVAVVCSVGAYAAMSLVMTAAPLAMTGMGHHHAHAMLGIQWHVIAMFLPSLFTGHLIARFGAEKIVATGFLILIGCAIIALAGTTVGHFWASLILLGLGWNFGFIGGSTLVTATYGPEEKEKVQGLNDLIVFTFVGLASLSSGTILAHWGWHAVVLAAIPISAICICALVWHAGRKRAVRA